MPKSNPILNRRFRVLSYAQQGKVIAGLSTGSFSRNFEWLIEAFHAEDDPGIRKYIVLSLKKLMNTESLAEISLKTESLYPLAVIREDQLHEAIQWHLGP